MKCWNCEEERYRVWNCPKDLKQSVRIRMKKAQQRRIERKEKEKDNSSESGKKYFMYSLWIRYILEN
jgi:hypothetical protein